MDSTDVTNNSSLDVTMDRSPDSGVSMDSKGSTPTEAPTDFSALYKEPSAPKKEELIKITDLDSMEVDLSGEQLPAEQQFKPLRSILKAPQGAKRKPHKLTILVPDNMDVDGSSKATISRRPGTPHPRKRILNLEAALAQEHPLKRSRQPGVSTDTIVESQAAFTTPAQVAIPPKVNALQLSSALPSVPSPNSSAFLFITVEVLAQRLSALTKEQFLAMYILVDCRYPYEYAGGHIKYAINIHNPEELPGLFFPSDDQRRTPIFYCEFSQKRGPAMAQELRRLDRAHHEYPDLDHDTIYVLRGGYKSFFESGFMEHCDPAGYMKMDNPSHRSELNKFTAHKKKKRSFGVSEQIASSSELEAIIASSSQQAVSHATTNALPCSPMLSGDFALARIASPPTTPKLKQKRPMKGEVRRLRFD